jgi:hypothetical protein
MKKERKIKSWAWGGVEEDEKGGGLIVSDSGRAG